MDKPVIEYDPSKGVFSGPYDSVILWPVNKENSDWHQTEMIIDRDENTFETTEYFYIPYNEDEVFDISI